MRPEPPALDDDRVARVLLVEDDAGDALLVRDLLDEVGAQFETVWVRSLREAVGALDAPVACVLLDLNLPDADGLDALDRVCDAAGDAAVVVLTGFADRALGLAAVRRGAEDYLTKGEVDGPVLVRSVLYAIER